MPGSAVRTYTDPDAYQAAIRDAQAEGVITGRGKFRAESTTIRLDRLSLQRCEETLPRTVYSAVDSKLFGIIFATSPAQQYSSTAWNWRRMRSLCSAGDRRGTIDPRGPVNGAPSR